MKNTARPFTVEVKRRGKRLVETPKTSIWPDPSILRAAEDVSEDDGGNPAAQAEAIEVSAKDQHEQTAMPRILLDLTDVSDEDPHHRAKNPGGKTETG
jgi:hypothetical protein